MSRLLVPLHLDVLLVRQDGGRFADAAMAAPTTDGQSHRELWKPPFSERAGGRKRGAHLHWALPDALTRGTVADDGSARFAAVPDRWLVLRLSPSSRPGQRAVRGWVLEADRAQAFPLDRCTEGGAPTEARQPLTALGHGDVAWAAYFDNVENRLAFHDDLADVAAGPLAYLVCGWHARDAHDPLADPALDTRAAVHGRLDELAWASFGRPSELGPPRATLYHGSVVRLAWPHPDADSPDVGGPPPASAVRVVLAGTTCEGLATLLARDDGEVRLLEAAHLGVLDELAEPDGPARLDAVLHASGFGSLPGGEIVEPVAQPQAPTTPPAPPPRAGEAPMAAASGPLAAAFFAPEVIARTFVLPDRVREATIGVGHLSDALSALPADESAPPLTGVVDVTRALPRFFHPGDPVVLIQGARRSYRHGGDGRFTADGRLACRLATEAITELAVRDPRVGAGARLAIRGQDLLARGVDNAAVPPECEALLREVALLDPGAAPVIARAALPRGASPEQVAAVRRRVEVEQTAWWATRDRRVNPDDLLAPSGLSGTLPSPVAVTPAVRPWTPLHLEWRAEFLPSSRGLADWRLDEVDFAPVDSPGDTGAPVTLEGRTC